MGVGKMVLCGWGRGDMTCRPVTALITCYSISDIFDTSTCGVLMEDAMARKGETGGGDPALSDEERKARRRARLRTLTGQAPAGAAEASGGAGDADVLAAMGGGMGGGGAAGGAPEMRRKAAARVYRMLTNTPPDETGMVEDTPFSKTGVARLMEGLRERAANEGQPGAKVAAGLLNFLAPSEGEPEVHGASLERLQRVARMAGTRLGGGMGGGMAGRRRGGLGGGGRGGF